MACKKGEERERRVRDNAAARKDAQRARWAGEARKWRALVLTLALRCHGLEARGIRGEDFAVNILVALGGHARDACEWAVARGGESGRAR